MPVSKWILPALAAVALAGCGGSSGEPQDSGASAAGGEPSIVQPGAPGEPSRRLSADEARDVESIEHTGADVEFMQGMLHHHAQALEMTALVDERSASHSVPLLAARTEASQESEMELIERWLRARGEDVPAASGHHGDHGGELMPGMLTEAEMARLRAATGTRFDRLFLKGMTRHHEGALRMVADLYERGGGAEAELAAFARHVEADQGIEIARMRELLADL